MKSLANNYLKMSSEHQPKLLKNLEKSLGGPVFEFGPGWGHKTKKWFKKYILGGKCTLCKSTRYILLLGAIILIFGGPQLREYFDDRENQKLTGQITISEVVQTGDSKTHVARRAVTEYLKKSDDLTLTPGQRIFVEAKLIQSINNYDFRVGQTIEFDPEQIHLLGHEAESLSPATLQKWEKYAREVKF